MNKKKAVVSRGAAMIMVAMIVCITGCSQISDTSQNSNTSSTLTIQFDTNKIRCTTLDTHIDISSGSKIKENIQLAFYPKSLPGGEIVNFWNIGSVSQQGNVYKVKKADANAAGVILVSYSTRTAVKFTIQFDSSKIECWNNEKKLTSGAKVDETTYIQCKVLYPEVGKNASWTISGKPAATREEGFNTLNIRIRKRYADSNNTISISYTMRNVENIPVVFDSTNIECRRIDKTELTSNEVQPEGTKLTFSTKDKKPVQWKTGTTTYVSKNNSITIVVAKNRTTDGKLVVTYIE